MHHSPTTLADLQQLLSEQIPESAQLEYKREFPPSENGGSVKLLRSVTAMANTQGGTIVYGMAAENGVPTTLVPFPRSAYDLHVQRLDQLCRDGVEPRLTHYRAEFVPTSADAGLLVVHVPRSYQRPHRVVASNHGQFYGRQAASVAQLDVAQLRAAFTGGEALTERIRRFRAERLMAIAAGATPLPLLRSPARVVLHLLPLAAFEGDDSVDIDFAAPEQHQSVMQCQPPGDLHHTTSRRNLDGRVIYAKLPDGGVPDYAQVYRDGRIEVLRTIRSPQFDGTTTSEWYSEREEKALWVALKKYMDSLQRLSVPAPAALMLSFVGMKSCTMHVHQNFWISRSDGFDRDDLIMPEVLIEDWTQDPGALLQSTFDLLWNAYGMDRSENYDHEGRWVGQSRRT